MIAAKGDSGERFRAISLTRAGWIALLLIGVSTLTAQAHEGEEPSNPNSSAQRQVLQLKEKLRQKPGSLQLQIRLARAYIVKGRDEGGHQAFAAAKTILDEVLKKAPGDKDALYLRAWTAMFMHRFDEAAVFATKGIERYPSAAVFYGVLSDAHLERGNIKRAQALVQKMLDLKPDQGSYSRAAHLRSVLGDPEGAVELWEMAIRAGSLDKVDTAWCYVELGNLYLKKQQAGKAEQAYQAAAALVPGYSKAEAGLSKLRKAAEAKPTGQVGDTQPP
jgi:tetratricopeptide (TPR) repeat protein